MGLPPCAQQPDDGSRNPRLVREIEKRFGRVRLSHIVFLLQFAIEKSHYDFNKYFVS